MPNHKWTDEDDAFLLSHSDWTNRMLAEHLGVSIYSARYRAQTIGLREDAKKEKQKYISGHSKCEYCEKACGGCSWSRAFVPVKGWNAVPTVLATHHGKFAESYHVISCPEFIDGRKKKQKPNEKPKFQGYAILSDSPCNRCLSKTVCDSMEGECPAWRKWFLTKWNQVVQPIRRPV